AIAREIRALSAPARASAAVIACTPVAFGLLVAVVDPAVVRAALASTVGATSIALGIVCELVGAWWMRALLASPLVAGSSVDDELADLADLVALALGAGLSVAASLAAVAPRLGGITGRVVRVSLARAGGGVRLHDEIASWPETLGPASRPVCDALIAAHDDGAPAAATIGQLATDLRRARRQQVAERVQKLPVLLLFPLVCCVLPAFVLIAVVPIALGSVLSLQGG
ncbi:MAG TPA: type II secretion system F family protein, partial [Acidimicrobiales bacterium]